jgi:hypothetical protein
MAMSMPFAIASRHIYVIMKTSSRRIIQLSIRHDVVVGIWNNSQPGTASKLEKLSFLKRLSMMFHIFTTLPQLHLDALHGRQRLQIQELRHQRDP